MLLKLPPPLFCRVSLCKMSLQKKKNPERPHEEWDFDTLPHGSIVHVHPRLLVKPKKV